MSWAKIDDTLCDHPKVIAAGLEALGLFALSLSHSARHLTDGEVTPGWVERAAGRRASKLAGRLVEAGLWERNGAGYLIHDYLHFNPSRAQVVARRDRDSKRK